MMQPTIGTGSALSAAIVDESAMVIRIRDGAGSVTTRMVLRQPLMFPVR